MLRLAWTTTFIAGDSFVKFNSFKIFFIFLSMSLIDSCEIYFGCRNLYEVLNIQNNVSEKEVRKAYHKLSLLCHPDRVDESKKLEATEKFKILGKVHSILSDPEKRAIYDETGIWGDDDDGDAFEECDWLEYWRLLFKKITIADIQKYEQEYKGSDDELRDLKKTYTNFKGDMDKIYECVPFVTLDDEERIRGRLQELIDSEELPSYELFTKEPKDKRQKRIRKLKKEEREAEEESKNKKKKEDENGMDDLAQAILARRQISTDNFLDALEKKYSNGNAKKKAARGRKSKA